jgi:hypothetical protein
MWKNVPSRVRAKSGTSRVPPSIVSIKPIIGGCLTTGPSRNSGRSGGNTSSGGASAPGSSRTIGWPLISRSSAAA